MRVFVTGATGAIGSRALPLLLDAGHQVTALSRSAENRERLEKLGASPAAADLFDVASLRRAMAGHEAVINLATAMPPSAKRMMLPGAWRMTDRIRRDGAPAVAVDALMREMLGVMRRGWSPLPGDPSAFYTSVAQSDAASAVIAALSIPPGIYNVAEDEPMRRGEWARSLAAAAGIAPPRPIPRWLTTLGGSTMRLLSRSQRISNRRLRATAG